MFSDSRKICWRFVNVLAENTHLGTRLHLPPRIVQVRHAWLQKMHCGPSHMPRARERRGERSGGTRGEPNQEKLSALILMTCSCGTQRSVCGSEVPWGSVDIRPNLNMFLHCERSVDASPPLHHRPTVWGTDGEVVGGDTSLLSADDAGTRRA